MRTRERGLSRTIRRVASMPSRPGMLTRDDVRVDAGVNLDGAYVGLATRGVPRPFLRLAAETQTRDSEPSWKQSGGPPPDGGGSCASRTRPTARSPTCGRCTRPDVLLRVLLVLVGVEGREVGDTHEHPFGAHEPGGRLAPWLLVSLDQDLLPLGPEFFDGVGDGFGG